MRIDIIDIIKGISIIMIVNVHLLSGHFFLTGSTYHVIAFFFASGLVHGMTEKWKRIDVIPFVQEKLKRLAYPFFTLSVCYILMHMLINVIRGDKVFNVVIVDAFQKTISLQGIGTLWFLPVLFFAEIIFFLIKKIRINDSFILSVGFIVIFISSALYNIGLNDYCLYYSESNWLPVLFGLYKLLLSSLIAIFFMDLGYSIMKYKKPIFLLDNVKKRKSFIMSAIICLFSLIVNIYYIKYYQGDLHKLDIDSPVIYILCSLLGIAFVCSLSFIIQSKSSKISKILSFFGKNSLIIMTTHTEYYINSIVYIAILSFTSLFSYSLSNLVVSGLSIVLIMLIEIPIIYLVNHTFLKRIYFLNS